MLAESGPGEKHLGRAGMRGTEALCRSGSSPPLAAVMSAGGVWGGGKRLENNVGQGEH